MLCFHSCIMLVFNFKSLCDVCLQLSYDNPMYTGFWKLCYQFFSLSTCYLEKLASNKVQHHHHPQARVAWLRPPPSYYFHVPTLSVDFHSADNLKTLGQKTLKNFQIAFSFSPQFFFHCVERGFVHINFSRVWVHTVIKNSVWKSYIEG